jgi:hypothetical protein
MAVNTRVDSGDRFDKIDKQFEEMRGEFTSVYAQLDKLTTIVIKGFDRIDRDLEKKADKEDLNRLYDLMDKISKKQEIDDDERLVMGHQLDRLDRWVHEVADKIGYKLSL